MEEHEDLRAKGNGLFKQKRFAEAAEAYSRALNAASCECAGERCTLLTNRSNAHFMLESYGASLRDANKALELDKSHDKAYFRRALALVKLGRLGEAIDTYEQAVKYAKDPSFFHPLLRRARHAKSKQEQAKHFPSLYPDQPSLPSSKREKERHRATKALEKLKGQVRNRNFKHTEILPGGVFSQLLDPASFAQATRGDDQPTGTSCLPESFLELLENDEYFSCLVGMFPQAEAKAQSIFKGMKEKAAKKGDLLDSAMEAALQPQVLHEAIAHQIVSLFRTLARKQSSAVAKSAELVASPDTDEAALDQLCEEAIKHLSDDFRRHTVIDKFLGDDDWRDLMCADAEDIVNSGKLVPGDVSRSTATSLMKVPRKDQHSGCWSCWLRPQYCEERYPAISELISRMHALPHELNLKVPHLKLQKPLVGHVLFRAQGSIPGAPPNANRFDGLASATDGSWGDTDNGIKVSAVYHFSRESSLGPAVGGNLVLSHGTGARYSIEPLHDRLVIYRSRCVSHSLDALETTDAVLFSIKVFFTGPEERPEW